MTGMPDFPHDNHAVTLSAGGPGYLMACLKCNACGYSRTPGAPVAAKQRDLSQIAQTNA